MGQVWSVNTAGGYMYSDELSDKLRMKVQPLVKFRQFCDAKDALSKGLKRGDAYHWDVFSDVATQGGTIVETNTMPKTNFTIQQGTLTVTEYGNSVDFTQKLDNLSKLPVMEVIDKVLKNDAKKTFDLAAFTQFNRTALRFVATTATDAGTLYTNGTATGTNSVALGKNHVKVLVDTMKERNIPPYLQEDYFAIGRPTTWRQLKNDLESIKQYTERGLDLIFNGEIGRYEGVRFVEQTNIASRAWTNGRSDMAMFFGQDTVAEALCVPEEMRGKIPGDYGRDRGVAWYYLGGFGIVHDRTMDVANSRIVVWDSQA